MRFCLLLPGVCLFAALVPGDASGQFSGRYSASRVYASQAAGNPTETHSISVLGRGEVRAQPNVIEIEMQTVGSAELTNDAIVKYQDAKRRTLQSFADLKMKNLHIEEGGLSISLPSPQQMQMRMNGMQNQKVKVPIEVSAPLHLRLTGVQDMSPAKMVEVVGQLVDLAKDCGALRKLDHNQRSFYEYDAEDQALGGALARFVLTDYSALREQAYQRAVADARKRAQRLADLNQLKLGGVINVNETYVSGEVESVQTGLASQKSTPEHPRIVSARFSEIPVQVMLQVSFAIEPAEPAKP